MKPTNFSRDFVKTAVDYKIAQPCALRDYDILKDREAGKSLQQIAIKHDLSKQSIISILKKYQ